MEHQVAFFNNANQIIFDLNNMINYHFFNNYIKETHYDKYNNTKNIIVNYTDYDNNQQYYIDYDNQENYTDYDNNQENYTIIVDVLTYNKINITKFSIY
jgi:hypothetical protein